MKKNNARPRKTKRSTVDSQLREMPLDELWELHKLLRTALTERLVEERAKTQARLSKIKPPQPRTHSGD